jgi:hypothetical protein
VRFRAARTLSLAALTVVAAGCGDTFVSVSSDGQLEVVINTTGTGVDPDGFSLSVDGKPAEFQALAGTVTLTGLSQGSHSVLLGGLANNCQVVDGANPRTVSVGANGTASVGFTIRCERVTTVDLTIVVGTTGEPADSDGYLLVVGDGGVRPIGPSASETFAGLVEGVHLVMLKGVASGCVLEGGNPQPLTVVAGQTVQVGLVVRCGPATQ